MNYFIKANTSSSETVDSSKLITITNNVTASICVLMPVINDPSNPATEVMVYGQDLELLISTNKNTSIQSSNSQTFMLDQYYTDPTTKQKKYATLYNMLVSTTDWFFPVANLSAIQIMSKYQPETVTNSSLKSMQDAAAFLQTISAYPTSSLATRFQNAMKKTTNDARNAADGSLGSTDAVLASITNNVNAFFKSTIKYRDVTLESFVAVQTYYKSFPFIWSGFNDKTFYLYSSTKNKTTQFMGAITLTRPAKLDVTKPNAGYHCSFAPAVTPSNTTSVAVDSSKSKDLVYLDGLFVDENDPDSPSLAVNGQFMVKSQFTQNSSDTDIIPVLIGYVNGIVSIGFDQAQKSNDEKNSDYSSVLFHPRGVEQIIQCVMSWGGAIMMLTFLGQTVFGMYKLVKGLFAAKKPTMRDVFESRMKAIEDLLKEQNQQAAQRMSDNKMQPPEDIDAAQQELNEVLEDIFDEISANKLYDASEAMASSCEELATYMTEMESSEIIILESISEEVEQLFSDVEKVTPETLHALVTEQLQEMKELHAKMADFIDSVSESLNEQVSETLSSNQDAVNELNEQLAESQQEQHDIPEDDDPNCEPIIEIE